MPQDQILSAPERGKRPALPVYSLHLDLVRGLAALIVLAGHLRVAVTGHTGVAAGGPSPSLLTHPANTTGLSHAAVVIFFVLSGYLVGGSVLRDLGRNAFSWTKYSFRRLARLWTVLIPTMVLGAVMDLVSVRFFSKTSVVGLGEFAAWIHGIPGIVPTLGYLSFLQSVERVGLKPFGSNVALWSLSNEFWYYVLFPLLAVGLIGTRFAGLQRAAMLLAAAFLLWFLGAGIVAYFPLWLCGVAAYLAPARIPARFQALATALLAFQFLAVLFYMRSVDVKALKADTLIACSFMLLLYAILHQVGPASAGLYSRLAHMVSFPSYSLYATHIPVCVLLSAACEALFPQLFRHTSLAGAVVCALVLAYAGVFYLIFERNTDRVRRFAEAHLLRRKTAALPS